MADDGRKGESGADIKFKETYFLTKYGIKEIEEIILAQRFGPRDTIRQILTMLPNDKNTVEDRISQLPIDVLGFIISLLPMKEGATTCVLSRQWRNIWRTSTTSLVFSTSTVFGDNYSKDIFFPTKGKSKVTVKQQSENILHREKRAFTRRVNTFLQSHPSLRINALQVSFPLATESASHIDRWLMSATTQGIIELKLDFNFSDFRLVYNLGEIYKFTAQTFTQSLGFSLKYLTLKCCIFEYPPDSKGLNSLVSLVLEKVNTTASDVQNILSSSSSLQILSMRSCFMLQSKCLKFSSPSPVLKYICCRSCVGIKEYEVDDINILFLELELSDRNSRLSIKIAPNLTRLKLASYYPIEFKCDVPLPLETLSLALYSLGSDWWKLFELSNLKQLVVGVKYDVKINLLDAIYLLEACPLLQNLEINMSTSKETNRNLEDIGARPGAPNHSLKEVDIYGFEGHLTVIEFIKYVLKNAIMLKRVRISTKQKEYLKTGLCCLRERAQKGGISIMDVPKLLEREVQPPTELIIESHD